MSYTPEYHNITLDDSVNQHYSEAGAKHLPKLLLLHGYPYSSTQFRDLVLLLAHRFHLIADDFPGYDQTTFPADLAYTFDNLANATIALLAGLQIRTYAMYVFECGAAVGWRLALNNPSASTAIISQNRNAYSEGFGQPFWQPIMETWNSNNPESAREWLQDNYLTLPPPRICNTPLALPKPTCLSSIPPTGRWISCRTCMATRTMNISSICSRTTDVMWTLIRRSMSIFACRRFRCRPSGAKVVRISFRPARRRPSVIIRMLLSSMLTPGIWRGKLKRWELQRRCWRSRKAFNLRNDDYISREMVQLESCIKVRVRM
jgi:pimeloyl-ACP methyl ester carboxylesterase